jgi:tRNA U34 5-carboxymethylaminomethyl modifying GTPase MnmE/TrmE
MKTDTIVAIATGEVVSAIAMIRLSGPEAISITENISKEKFFQEPNHTLFIMEGSLMKKEKYLMMLSLAYIKLQSHIRLKMLSRSAVMVLLIS